jgi:hypothetical protein
MTDDAVWHAWKAEGSESAFPDFVRAEVHTTVVDAKSDQALEFFKDPLCELMKHVEGVGRHWTVSLNRINADRVTKGPRKLTIFWMVFHELEAVHGIAYRTPQPEDWLAEQAAAHVQ